MFLRCNRRLKDGKSHEYWSVVENRRLNDVAHDIVARRLRFDPDDS